MSVPRVELPPTATTWEELLHLIQREKKRIKHRVSQPNNVNAMRNNLLQLPQIIRHTINKTALVSSSGTQGIEEIIPEIAKYLTTLTDSVRILQSALCDSIANDLITHCCNSFDHIHQFCQQIQQAPNKLKSCFFVLIFQHFFFICEIAIVRKIIRKFAF